jgi:ABC-2 type transport system permease protein
MSSMMTVIKFTFMNRIRTKSFLIGTLVLVILMSIAIHLPSIISSFSSDKPTNIGVLASASNIPSQLKQYFNQHPESNVKIVILPNAGSLEENEKAAKLKISIKELIGYLQLVDNKSAGFPKFTYKSEATMRSGIKNTLQSALQQIKTDLVVKDIGLSEQQLNQLKAPVEMTNEQITLKSGEVTKGKSEEEIGMATGLVYILLILLFTTLQLYGQLIATEVTAEKSSRVMELLISSVSPLKQMFGKVIGMFLLGLSQIAAFAIVVTINLNLPDISSFLAKNNIHISDIPFHLLVYFIIFYILGFFLYAMLYAAVGSLVSRTEDIGQTIMPVLMLMMGGYFIGIYGISNPTSSFISAMSFVPFFTPMIMFLRIGLTDPSWLEIALSILVLLITILCAGWLSSRIYRIGVLMYGKRPSFKEVLKAMRAYGA